MYEAGAVTSPGNVREIIVFDRAEHRLPFSRGIMATSLLATGVATEEPSRSSDPIPPTRPVPVSSRTSRWVS